MISNAFRESAKLMPLRTAMGKTTQEAAEFIENNPMKWAVIPWQSKHLYKSQPFLNGKVVTQVVGNVDTTTKMFVCQVGRFVRVRPYSPFLCEILEMMTEVKVFA